MQLPLLLLVALYAVQALTGWQRHLRRVLLALAIGLLAVFHLAFTLPYETHGGVFAVLAPNAPTVWFDDAKHAEIYYHLTGQPRYVLPADFCQNAPVSERAWWVVREDVSCPVLDSADVIGRYQADRSRMTWVIYEMTPAD